MVHLCIIKTNSLFLLEVTPTFAGEGGVVFSALRNQTAKERARLKEQTIFGKAVVTNFELNSVSAGDSLEASTLPAQFVNKVHIELELDTSSGFCSFAQNFLSTTEESGEGLLENEMRKRTDPQLLKAVPGPDLLPSFFRERDERKVS